MSEQADMRIRGVLAHSIEAGRAWECELCRGLIAQGDLYWYVNAFYPYRVCTKCGESERTSG